MFFVHSTWKGVLEMHFTGIYNWCAETISVKLNTSSTQASCPTGFGEMLRYGKI